MQTHLLWLPPAQRLEGIDVTTRSTREGGEPAASLTEAQAVDPLHWANRLAPAALAVIAEWRDSPPVAAAGGSERHIEYDGYFGVRRLAGDNHSSSIGKAALVAFYRVMTDALRGHSLRPADLADLQAAFHTTSTLVSVPQPIASGAAAPLSSPAEPPRLPVDALLRWKLGHHAFFVMIQALIIVHARLAFALRAQRLSEAGEALSQAARLWWGTAAAFRYTADFTAEDYEELVRPSMRPPFLKEGFSGFFSSDHSYLIRALKLLQPSLQRLPAELGDAHRHYLRSLDDAYEAHAYVCEQFVGMGHSLRQGHQERPSSAPTIIRRDLKERTLLCAGGGTER